MSTDTPPKLTILLLGAFPPQAQGIPGYCAALARALATEGEVRALGFKAMYPAALFPGVKTAMDPTSPAPEAPGLTVRHVLAWYNPVGWLWHAFTDRAEIIHIQWWSLPLFPVCLTFALAARARRIPVVVTAHNVLPHEPSPWFLRASAWLYRLADAVLVHSESNRAQFETCFAHTGAKVEVVPMAREIAPIVADSAEARRRLGIESARKVVLFFGTIRPYKGLDTLLEAVGIARVQHPELLLIIAGKPWESWAPYAERITSLGLVGNVLLRLDYIPELEVPDFFAAADLVALPYTHFDAQSAVGAQVLGHGTPMIVSDTGGLPELVGRREEWVVPPRNAEVLAERIAWFFGDAPGHAASFRESGGAAGGPEAVAEAHWEIYCGLILGDRM